MTESYRTRSIGVLVAFLVAAPILANTYTVTNTADSGAGSLRQAVSDANAHAGADLITFAIPGSAPFVIALSTPITITGPVTIDGSTQDSTASTPVVEIQIRFAQLISAASLVIINDLMFTAASASAQFPNDCCSAVRVDSGSLTLSRCWIGGSGPGKLRNHIGVTTAFRTTATFIGNLISGNDVGLQIDGTATIDGNLIGVDPTGTFSIPNTTYGIWIRSGSANIGTSERNVISGNGTGIFVDRPFDTRPRSANITGNWIGTDVSGQYAIPNGTGVETSRDAPPTTITTNVVSGNTVGLLVGAAATVTGNIVGLRYDMLAPLPNGTGITGSGGTITNNVISGNGYGITTSGVVDHNWIGTDRAGNPFGNLHDGVSVKDGGGTYTNNVI